MSDRARTSAALADASALVRLVAGDDFLGDTGELSGDLPHIAMMLTCTAARRALQDPNDVQAETIGEYSVTYRTIGSGAWLTAAEERLLRRAVGLSSVGSIDLRSAFIASDDTVWIDTSDGGQYPAFSTEQFPDGL